MYLIKSFGLDNRLEYLAGKRFFEKVFLNGIVKRSLSFS
jgi:hypothetical protein